MLASRVVADTLSLLEVSSRDAARKKGEVWLKGRSERAEFLDHHSSWIPTRAVCTVPQLLAIRVMVAELVQSDKEPWSDWRLAAETFLRYLGSLDTHNGRKVFRAGQAQCAARKLLWSLGGSVPARLPDVQRLLNPSAYLSPTNADRLGALYQKEGIVRADRLFDLATAINLDAEQGPFDRKAHLDRALVERGVEFTGLPEGLDMTRFADLGLSISTSAPETSVEFLEWDRWTHGAFGSTGVVRLGDRIVAVVENQLYDEVFGQYSDVFTHLGLTDIFEFSVGPDGPNGVAYTNLGEDESHTTFRLENGLIVAPLLGYEPGQALRGGDASTSEAMSPASSPAPFDSSTAREPGGSSGQSQQIQELLRAETPAAMGLGYEPLKAMPWEKGLFCTIVSSGEYPWVFVNEWMQVGPSFARIRLRIDQFQGRLDGGFQTLRRYDLNVSFSPSDIAVVELLPGRGMNRYDHPDNCEPHGIVVRFKHSMEAKRFHTEAFNHREQTIDMDVDHFVMWVRHESAAIEIKRLLDEWSRGDSRPRFSGRAAPSPVRPSGRGGPPEPPGSTVRA